MSVVVRTEMLLCFFASLLAEPISFPGLHTDTCVFSIAYMGNACLFSNASTTSNGLDVCQKRTVLHSCHGSDSCMLLWACKYNCNVCIVDPFLSIVPTPSTLQSATMQSSKQALFLSTSEYFALRLCIVYRILFFVLRSSFFLYGRKVVPSAIWLHGMCFVMLCMKQRERYTNENKYA